MKNRVIKRLAVFAILCVMVTVFAAPAFAASYSKVYGQTQDRVRVRDAASTNATIIDNVVKNACVYVTSSTTSGGNTFVKVKYRAEDGEVETGWICQSDGKNTYVKILSATQAQSKFSVSGGEVPSKRVGTFTAAQRKASASSSDSTYIKLGTTNSATVRDVQIKLKGLGIYSGEITGNVGEKTEAAIKTFQSRYGLTADGVAGPQTLAKIDAVYASKGGSASVASGSGLKLGSTGTGVRDLQQDLTALGFYWAEITGNFGSKTEAAVKRFQEENGLTADGVAGTKTLNAVAAAVAKKGGVSSSSSSSGTTLKLNSQGTKVSMMQEDLKTLGYYYAEITGNFGEKTEAAVKAFQKAKGLTPDGVAGKKTLDAIAAAVGSSSAGSPASGLKLGSTGDKVRALQQNLTTLGLYYGDITGHYGSMTQAAVKKFQKKQGLTQDGVAGTTTLNAVTAAVKKTGSTPATGSAGSTATTSLREGDSGTAVTDLQTRLKKLGIYYGDITGDFGDLTKRAVKAFQDKNGLTVDGVAGPATLNKLRTMTGSSAIIGGTTDSSGTGSAVSTDKSYGRITKANVNLRSSYSTSSAAKASLSKGKTVRVSRSVISDGSTWYYISVDIGKYTYKGYVRSDMLEFIKASEYGSDAENSAGGAETLGMIRVTGNNVALRYEPKTSADKVDSANTGDVFYYVDVDGSWYQTSSGYWIKNTYAKEMTDAEIEAYLGINTSETYRYDDTSTTIGWIQQILKDLKYYKGTISNHFGSKTEKAVKEFQKAYGLTADGVVGPTTMAKLISASGGGTTSVKIGDAYDLNWFNAKNGNRLATYGIARGKYAKLTDLRTGISMQIYFQSAGNHADVEPRTLEDTQAMCRMFGVADPSKIDWRARPMLMTVTGTDKVERQIVCSIYGEAHGAQNITDNGYDGQFCLHFTGSKTHNSGETLQRHKDAIAEAIKIIKADKKTVTNLN